MQFTIVTILQETAVTVDAQQETAEPTEVINAAS